MENNSEKEPKIVRIDEPGWLAKPYAGIIARDYQDGQYAVDPISDLDGEEVISEGRRIINTNRKDSVTPLEGDATIPKDLKTPLVSEEELASDILYREFADPDALDGLGQ